jgi:hypothetical protein
MNDFMEYAKNENFKYLVIKVSYGNYYGFNLKVKMERAYAMKIVSSNEPDNFIVGWKVVKKLPRWVQNANSWTDFINGKEEEEMEEKEEAEEDDKEEEE